MLYIVILGVIAAIIGVSCGVQLQKRHFQQEIDDAKATSAKMIAEAQADAKENQQKFLRMANIKHLIIKNQSKKNSTAIRLIMSVVKTESNNDKQA